MKKLLIVLVVAGALMLIPITSFSQNANPTNQPSGKPAAVSKSPVKKGAVAPKPMAKPNDMMKRDMMMPRLSMVASGDGGVIVMAGNRLMKYDRDLNLVKEVEIKMPWERGKMQWEKGEKSEMFKPCGNKPASGNKGVVGQTGGQDWK